MNYFGKTLRQVCEEQSSALHGYVCVQVRIVHKDKTSKVVGIDRNASFRKLVELHPELADLPVESYGTLAGDHVFQVRKVSAV